MEKKIIYNVTVKIDLSSHEDWITWMQEKHIPDVMATGYFNSYKLSKILYTDESDGITYAIQYLCNSIGDLEDYQKNCAAQLQKEHTDRYKDKYVAFRTLLEVENEG